MKKRVTVNSSNILFPNDSTLEAAVLGCALENRGDSRLLRDIVNNLDYSDFYLERHKSIFSIMKQMVADEQPLDPLTLKDELDHKGLLAVREQYQYDIEKLEESFKKLAGDINSNSTKQLIDLFYSKRGYKPYYKTTKTTSGETKQTITVDEKAMKRLSIKGCEEAKLVLSMRTKKKLLSHWSKRLLST